VQLILPQLLLIEFVRTPAKVAGELPPANVGSFRRAAVLAVVASVTVAVAISAGST
jgi:hypothetical protein